MPKVDRLTMQSRPRSMPVTGAEPYELKARLTLKPWFYLLLAQKQDKVTSQKSSSDETWQKVSDLQNNIVDLFPDIVQERSLHDGLSFQSKKVEKCLYSGTYSTVVFTDFWEAS